MKKIEKNEKNNHNKDPFEINLLQIKQTNDILNSIETKLNEVLSRSPQKVSNLPSASKYLLSPFSNRKKNILKENDNQNNFKLISERKKINEFQESQIFDNIGSRIYFDENQLEIDGRSLRAEDLKSKDELDEEVRKLKERLFLLERENELKQEELMTSKRQIESLKGNKNFEDNNIYKEKNNELQKIILKLEEENLKLKDDCNNFLKKNEELKKHIDDLQDDKQRLSVSYDQLLDMQNKLVKFDLIKQENKLRVSTTESSFASPKSTNSLHESKILSNLQKYHTQIERIKSNSANISEQYVKDLESLQQQLVFQQKVNQNLQSQITTNGNLSEYIKRLEYSVNNFEKKYSEQVQINAELTTLLKNININSEKERDKSRNNKKSIKSMKYK